MTLSEAGECFIMYLERSLSLVSAAEWCFRPATLILVALTFTSYRYSKVACFPTPNRNSSPPSPQHVACGGWGIDNQTISTTARTDLFGTRPEN
ncbi:hypothetical protein BaRGS_00026504 [Batillaria attramentaria]|uniref:Uncharacterized protein n=1 Tax=Batillaria attramentaria TaxID=370345 RepID=A0ABD0K5Q6_9CAEN